ncbi:MAG: hypothetical protein M1817_001254 [Caeruleum heppii]|nr:MAG: hypothetical protein M1817_001254 [Caeruleum heppii]
MSGNMSDTKYRCGQCFRPVSTTAECPCQQPESRSPATTGALDAYHGPPLARPGVLPLISSFSTSAGSMQYDLSPGHAPQITRVNGVVTFQGTATFSRGCFGPGALTAGSSLLFNAGRVEFAPGTFAAGAITKGATLVFNGDKFVFHPAAFCSGFFKAGSTVIFNSPYCIFCPEAFADGPVSPKAMIHFPCHHYETVTRAFTRNFLNAESNVFFKGKRIVRSQLPRSTKTMSITGSKVAISQTRSDPHGVGQSYRPPARMRKNRPERVVARLAARSAARVVARLPALPTPHPAPGAASRPDARSSRAENRAADVKMEDSHGRLTPPSGLEKSLVVKREISMERPREGLTERHPNAPAFSTSANALEIKGPLKVQPRVEGPPGRQTSDHMMIESSVGPMEGLHPARLAALSAPPEDDGSEDAVTAFLDSFLGPAEGGVLVDPGKGLGQGAGNGGVDAFTSHREASCLSPPSRPMSPPTYGVSLSQMPQDQNNVMATGAPKSLDPQRPVAHESSAGGPAGEAGELTEGVERYGPDFYGHLELLDSFGQKLSLRIKDPTRGPSRE